MVINKYLIGFILTFFFFKNVVFASQILDFETEKFISSIITEIKVKNKINKKINFKILSRRDINAFVDQYNTIHLTSALIENCYDYVALTSVIAHEIGHIDKNHISIRKHSMDKLNDLNKLASLSIIAGSLISNNPQLLQTFAITSATSSQSFINFSKEQEREADFYSIETLKKLNINSYSIIKLLETIEKKSIQKGFGKEKQRISTHPYFEERINLFNYIAENENLEFDKDKNKEFNFIKAKFLGYNNSIEIIHNTEKVFKNYSYSIIEANNGNLQKSLEILNEIILENPKNKYLYETKADILLSHGYTKEAVGFYKLVLKFYPENFYAQIRIFENIDYNKLSIEENISQFYSNINLLKNFYNNRNVLNTYLNLSKKLNKMDWFNFFNLWINKSNYSNEELRNELNKFLKSSDEYLIDLIKIINKNNL